MSTPTRGRGSLQQPEQRRPDGTKPGMSKAAASKIDPHRKKILLMGHKRLGDITRRPKNISLTLAHPIARVRRPAKK